MANSARKLALGSERLQRLDFKANAGLLPQATAIKKAERIGEKFGLQGSPRTLLDRFAQGPKLDTRKLDFHLSSSHPLRDGKVAVDAMKDWDRQSGISRHEQDKKQEHVAGKSKASQMTDAYPFVMMALDLKADGAYYAASQLSPGRPSPVAVLIGDNHLTNAGSTPLHGGELVYGNIDPTKAGVGRIEADVARLATTSVVTGMREGKLSRNEALGLAQASAQAYLEELGRFADSGKKPDPYLRPNELQSSLLKGMLGQARKRSADAEVRKYSKDGSAFNKEFALPKAERKAVERAFQDYTTRLPSRHRSIRILDIGTKVDVGGSNSGMPHYLVLGEHNGKKDVFEMKQLIPSPVEHTSGKPDKVDAANAFQLFQAIGPSVDPNAGYAVMNGIAYGVQPYDSQERTLSFSKPKLEELLDVVRDTARLTARIHAQTLKPAEAKQWLQGFKPSDGTARLVKFSEVYSNQLEVDAAAVH